MVGLEELYWFLKLGKPRRKLTVFQLRAELNTYIKDPVFFLSTGRCGTKWFSELLLKERELAIFHDPLPNLSIQGKLAWELFRKYQGNLPEESEQLLAELFLAGREQHLRYTAKTGKRYVETNNYITFFAPVLAKLFPDAKFVHIVRHPKGFVRSGLNRSYYEEQNLNDAKRIIDGENKDWESLSRHGKIAWLWNETNTFIEDFSKTIPSERIIVFPFDLSDSKGIDEVMKFLDVNISEKQIRKMLSVKVNVQKEQLHPAFDKWSDLHKQEVKAITSELAEKYNFHF